MAHPECFPFPLKIPCFASSQISPCCCTCCIFWLLPLLHILAFAVARITRSRRNTMDFCTLPPKDAVTASPSQAATGVFLNAPLEEHTPSLFQKSAFFPIAKPHEQSSSCFKGSLGLPEQMLGGKNHPRMGAWLEEGDASAPAGSWFETQLQRQQQTSPSPKPS